jgi:hypothetical protein
MMRSKRFWRAGVKTNPAGWIAMAGCRILPSSPGIPSLPLAQLVEPFPCLFQPRLIPPTRRDLQLLLIERLSHVDMCEPTVHPWGTIPTLGRFPKYKCQRRPWQPCWNGFGAAHSPWRRSSETVRKSPRALKPRNRMDGATPERVFPATCQSRPKSL